MALRRREDIEGRKGRDIARLAKQGGSSLLYTTLVVIAAAVLIGISMRLRFEKDVSRQAVNRLSPQTLEVLANLDRDVTLYALYQKQPSAPRELYWNLLKRYRAASPRITARFYDPVAQPGIVQRLELDVQQQGQGIQGVTVAVAGGDKVVFRGRDEEDVTNALLEVGREGKRVVGLLRGYGERDPQSPEASGFLAAVAALEQEYYEVRDVRLEDGLADDLSVLVVAGPRLPIGQAELDRLAEWLEGGGRLMALLDPGAEVGLNAVLDRWGLQALGHQILDQRENIRGDPAFLRATEYSKVHPIVKGFGKNMPTAFAIAGAVEHYEPGDPLVFHDALIKSSHFSQSFAPDGTRAPGPLDLAAASWKQETLDGVETVTRLVLVGDSDFATSVGLSVTANRNFLLNCVGWLTRQEQLVSIRKQPLAGQFFLIRPEENVWIVAAVTTAPVLLLLAGVVVAARRRVL